MALADEVRRTNFLLAAQLLNQPSGASLERSAHEAATASREAARAADRAADVSAQAVSAARASAEAAAEVAVELQMQREAAEAAAAAAAALQAAREAAEALGVEFDEELWRAHQEQLRQEAYDRGEISRAFRQAWNEVHATALQLAQAEAEEAQLQRTIDELNVRRAEVDTLRAALDDAKPPPGGTLRLLFLLTVSWFVIAFVVIAYVSATDPDSWVGWIPVASIPAALAALLVRWVFDRRAGRKRAAAGQPASRKVWRKQLGELQQERSKLSGQITSSEERLTVVPQQVADLRGKLSPAAVPLTYELRLHRPLDPNADAPEAGWHTDYVDVPPHLLYSELERARTRLAAEVERFLRDYDDATDTAVRYELHAQPEDGEYFCYYGVGCEVRVTGADHLLELLVANFATNCVLPPGAPDELFDVHIDRVIIQELRGHAAALVRTVWQAPDGTRFTLKDLNASRLSELRDCERCKVQWLVGPAERRTAGNYCRRCLDRY